MQHTATREKQPPITCAHCGSESGPHYITHKVNHTDKTIEPEAKQTCHTCYHTHPGQFIQQHTFSELQAQKQAQEPEHHQTTVPPAWEVAAAPAHEETAETPEPETPPIQGAQQDTARHKRTSRK